MRGCRIVKVMWLERARHCVSFGFWEWTDARKVYIIRCSSEAKITVLRWAGDVKRINWICQGILGI